MSDCRFTLNFHFTLKLVKNFPLLGDPYLPHILANIGQTTRCFLISVKSLMFATLHVHSGKNENLTNDPHPHHLQCCISGNAEMFDYDYASSARKLKGMN